MTRTLFVALAVGSVISGFIGTTSLDASTEPGVRDFNTPSLNHTLLSENSPESTRSMKTSERRSTLPMTSACSLSDRSALQSLPQGTGEGSLGDHSMACSRHAFSIFFGLYEQRYVKCMQRRTGLSAGCARCYSGFAKYGATNCKSVCMRSWCSSGCFKCGVPYLSTLDQCTGLTSASPPSCDTVVV